MKITLPWPNAKLSPNARLHWGAKHSHRAKAREDGRYCAYASMGAGLREVRAHFSGDAPIPLTITFYPPDARHRDDDNMVGSFKSYRDGIADALGVNDRRFRTRYVFAEACKPGRVEVLFHNLSGVWWSDELPESLDSAIAKERTGERANAPPALTTNDEVPSHGS